MLTATRYQNPYLLIAGDRITADDRPWLPVVNPSTGLEIGRLPIASTDDLDRALAASVRGFERWSALTAFDRCGIMRQGATLIRERAEAIATQQTLEGGKRYRDSLMEILGCAEHIEWSAEEGRRLYGRVVPPRSADGRAYVIRQPFGPVVAFTPWNFPGVLPARKMGAGLGAGNSMIVKPAEETPMTALLLAEALIDGGVPADALQIVYGVPSKISAHLIASPVVRKVSFTGSTVVGKALERLAADGVKATTMELGGHAPVIVFADADVENAAEMCAMNKMRNVGQVCISPTRFFVHRNIYAAFVERMASVVAGLHVGDGFNAATDVGPLANARRVDAMERLIFDAVANGARLVTGGKRIAGDGYFFEPTVLADVPPHAAIMNEEPFGPVAVLTSFESFDEVIAEANRLPFGLAGYAFTESISTAHRVAEKLEVGMLSINGFGLGRPETPFGGVKESGFGSDDAIDYTVAKTVVYA